MKELALAHLVSTSIGLLCLVGVLRCSSTPPAVTVAPPAWVVCLPPAPGQLRAVGVAAARIKPEDTIDEACGHARTALARAVAAQVISASLAVSWESTDYGEAASAAEVPPGLEEQVAANASNLDSWVDPSTGNGYCLAAVPMDQGGGACTAALAEVPDLCDGPEGGRPAWTDKIPAGPGTMFAVGVGRNWAYRANAMDDAVVDGMGQLSSSLTSTVSGVLSKAETTLGVRFAAQEYLSSKTALSGAQPVAWWTDPDGGKMYVLMCLPLAGVKVHLASAAAPAAQAPAAPDGPADPEQFHEQKLEKLRNLLDSEL